MGYYSRHRLTKSTSAEFLPRLIARVGYDPFEERCTWYDCDDDVSVAMRETKTASVVIHREGEEQGDVCDLHYKLVGQRVNIKRVNYKLVPEEDG